MEAKDTVMNETELQKGYCEGCYDVEYLIKRQAEISFKAGEDKGYAHARQHCEDVIIPQAEVEARREVVEWVDDNCLNCRSNTLSNSDEYLGFHKESWQLFKLSRGL